MEHEGLPVKNAQSLPKIIAGDFGGITEALGQQQGLSVCSVNFQGGVTVCGPLGRPGMCPDRVGDTAASQLGVNW